MDTKIFEGIALIALPLGVAYIAMGFIVYKHAERKVLGASSWWAFNPRNYKGKADVMCKAGRVIVYVSTALCLPYLVILLSRT
jgi:hypothetical protein